MWKINNNSRDTHTIVSLIWQGIVLFMMISNIKKSCDVLRELLLVFFIFSVVTLFELTVTLQKLRFLQNIKSLSERSSPLLFDLYHEIYHRDGRIENK